MENTILEKYKLLPPEAQQTVADFVDFLFEKYKKERLEITLGHLGFKNPYYFFHLRMFGEDKRWQKDNVVSVEAIEKELEKQNIAYVTYLEMQIGAFLQEKIANFAKEIQYFEQKYQMTWEEMHERYYEIEAKDIIEKEDDYMNWVSALDLTISYQESLKDITYGRTEPSIGGI